MKYAFSLILVLSTGAHAADQVLLKNAREIYASFAAIMNVDPSTPSLREVFRLNSDRLPRAGQPEELSNSAVMATTELGGAFCKVAVEREKTIPHGQRTLFSDGDFKRGPSQFTDYLRGLLFERLGMAFWQRDLSPQEKPVLANILTNAKAPSADTPEETVKVLQVLCTTYATSLSFLVK